MSLNSRDVRELAGEYVLGTLSAAGRREVELRLRDDPELRFAAERWHEQLLPLAALADPVAPTPRLWRRIERSVAQSGRPAAREAVKVSPAGRWWSSVALWRGLAGTGFATAALMAAVLVTREAPTSATPPFMVVLVTPQDKLPGWVIQASSARQLSLMPLGQVDVPAGKTLQFWTKGEGWNAPVSLGLVKPGQTLQVALDKLPPLQANQLFELTLEPANGSPIGKPTGPIQYIGRSVKML